MYQWIVKSLGEKSYKDEDIIIIKKTHCTQQTKKQTYKKFQEKKGNISNTQQLNLTKIIKTSHYKHVYLKANYKLPEKRRGHPENGSNILT